MFLIWWILLYVYVFIFFSKSFFVILVVLFIKFFSQLLNPSMPISASGTDEEIAKSHRDIVPLKLLILERKWHKDTRATRNCNTARV